MTENSCSLTYLTYSALRQEITFIPKDTTINQNRFLMVSEENAIVKLHVPCLNKWAYIL